MRSTILSLLCVVALIAYVQRAAISVPLKEIADELQFADPTRQGMLLSAWYLGYALFQMPAGAIADRIGGRVAIVMLAVLWSLATAVTACSRSFTEMLVTWSAMGALQAGVFPCAVRSIGRMYGEREQARASGLLGAGMSAGGALAPILTGWLLERIPNWTGPGWPSAWRTCLVLYAVPGIAWAAAYWFLTRGRLADDAPAPAARAAGPGTGWSRILGDRTLLLLCGQHFLRSAAMLFFVTWFPTFLRETRGVSRYDASRLTTIAGAAALTGVLCGGFVSDWLLARTGSKRIARQGIAVVGMSCCALLITASLFVEHVPAAIALISLGAFVATFGGVAGYTVAIDYGGSRVGTVFGAMNMAGGIGALLFPWTVGELVKATGTWNSALVLFAVLMAVDAVLWALLNPRSRFLEDGAVPAASRG